MYVELCGDSILLADIRQNVNVFPSYVLLHCAVHECSDVSHKRTATETSQKSPTAHHKTPTDHKQNSKTQNLTKSKCPQIPLQLPNITSHYERTDSNVERSGGFLQFWYQTA